MLIGHSFGAYTAVQMAGDAMFNHAQNGVAGYHVNITHVVAAGADTDSMAHNVQNRTNLLVINNTADAAYRVESALGLNEPSGSPTVKESLFNGGIGTDAGHGLSRYANHVATTHDPVVTDFLEDISALYGGSGQGGHISVRDPLR